MPRAVFADLADCSEFRQTVAARPPAIVHGTMLLLAILLAAAITWSALVKADLVVRAPGRVRPVETPTHVFTSGSADLEGRVVEAPFEEGDLVRRGDVLVRFDTAGIDNRITKLERTLKASDEELSTLASLESLLEEQLGAAREKAQAELVQAETALARAEDRRLSEIRAAKAEVHAAEDHLRRVLKLRDTRAAAEQDLVKAENQVRQTREKLVLAELPVDESQVAICRRALDLVERDFAVRRAELEARRVIKQGEAEAARKELAHLNRQRAESVLRSPIDGVVVSGRIQPGDVLAPGKPVMEIARRQSHRFEAIVPSQDVGNLRLGMPVKIKFDAYDYQRYGVLEGTVVYISPDSRVPEAAPGADTSGDPALQSPAAFLVRVKLHADEVRRGELRGPVKLGLGGTAEVVTDRRSVLAILVKRIRQTISLG